MKSIKNDEVIQNCTRKVQSFEEQLISYLRKGRQSAEDESGSYLKQKQEHKEKYNFSNFSYQTYRGVWINFTPYMLSFRQKNNAGNLYQIIMCQSDMEGDQNIQFQKNLMRLK